MTGAHSVSATFTRCVPQPPHSQIIPHFSKIKFSRFCMANHGGNRTGAGRPKGSSSKREPTTQPAAPSSKTYDSAEDYLLAVICGTEPADPVRVSAARGLLPYQRGKQRAPLASKPPSELQRAEGVDAELEAKEIWRKKSEAVRARLTTSKE